MPVRLAISSMNPSQPGLLIRAGGGHGLPLNYTELERWTRVGYERGIAIRRGER
jgi:hypothetical protein